jgi:hypothetical protein
MSASTAIAINAQAAALRAEVSACQAVVSSFDSHGATVAESKQYAHCIDLLHPSEIGPDGIIALKVVFVIAMVGFVYGAACEHGLFDRFMTGMLCFFGLPMALGCVGGIFYGIYWLFT